MLGGTEHLEYRSPLQCYSQAFLITFKVNISLTVILKNGQIDSKKEKVFLNYGFQYILFRFW